MKPGSDGTFPLVVVSNRLPLVYSVDSAGQSTAELSPGGLVAAVAPALAGRHAAWVGWSGDDHPHPSELIDGFTVFPIPLGSDLVSGHYEGFSNSALWPLFHHVGVEPEFRDSWFEAYKSVNERFAAEAARIVAPGGMVWVHDYHAMLVPEMLRALRPDVRIGYFHHIPFPEIGDVKRLPHWKELIAGVAAADIIGFQSETDAARFRAIAGPIFGRVKAYPISIDAELVERHARAPGVIARARQIREELGNPSKILLGADRIDYTKGIPERLEAYGRALDTGALSVEDTVFIQAGSPSRESVDSYRHLQRGIEELVADINNRFTSSIGRPAVVYRAENLDREELLALFVAADVMVVSSLRDGMNLVAKEYVACRSDDTGVLVLSTQTGAADQMTDALLVDPSDIDALSQVMVTACHMDPLEAATRMKALRVGVKKFDVSWWANTYLHDLASQS